MISRKRRLLLAFSLLLVCGGTVYVRTLFKQGVVIDRVVLITIDALRADHLGAYGYIQKTSPFFDQLAEQGILFENHVASMASTVPSHASLFASQYPLQHRVLKNGHQLDNAFLTMAETFQEMGYYTAGIVSTVGHFKAGNLHQGFEYFDEPDKELFKGPRYRLAEDTIQAAINWLNTRDVDEKFLLWIHLFDPHTPLRPPQDHYDTLLASAEHSDLLTYWIEQQQVAQNYFANKEQMIRTITLYDAEIRYADHELQRLYQYYQQQGFDHKSVWIITADHGEGVGNHNWWEHGKHIYNEQLRIPLLFYFSSAKGKNQTVETIVENIDVFPTLLELANNSAPALSTLQGNSFLPLLFSQHANTYLKSHAFSQRRLFDGPVPEEIIPKQTNYEEGETYALQSTHYKYIYRTHGVDEFFDLRNDPYETNNLINKGLREEKPFRQALLQKIAELKQDTTAEYIQVDEEAMEQLESLGYVQ
jgi:arylsulfatase A-like enzyme